MKIRIFFEHFGTFKSGDDVSNKYVVCSKLIVSVVGNPYGSFGCELYNLFENVTHEKKITPNWDGRQLNCLEYKKRRLLHIRIGFALQWSAHDGRAGTVDYYEYR